MNCEVIGKTALIFLLHISAVYNFAIKITMHCFNVKKRNKFNKEFFQIELKSDAPVSFCILLSHALSARE